MLEEGVGNHRHEGITVQPVPGPSFEVVEPELLFQLLMGLLADPASLDGGGELAQSQRRWQVGEVVLRLPGGAVFTDEPGFLARQMLLALVPDPLRRTVSDAHADRCEPRYEAPFRSGAP